MARQARIEYEGAFYHVTSRGNRREKIFFHEKDKEKFVEILRRTKGRYGYLLHAYALMDNHYHLLIETPRANLSRIMQNINTSYTVFVNRKYGNNGHLYQGRFKGLVVDKDEYLVTLSRYIHLNPVRAGIVQRPEDSKWTSYWAYRGKRGTEGLVDTSDALKLFSKEKQTALKKYKAFTEAQLGGSDNPFEETEAGLILGNAAFRDRVMGMVESLRGNAELPQIRRLTEDKSVRTIVRVCAEYFDIAEGELIRRRRGLLPRQIAIYLAKVFSGKTNKEIGEYFDIKGMAVSRVLNAIEDKMPRDKALREQIDNLRLRVLSVK